MLHHSNRAEEVAFCLKKGGEEVSSYYDAYGDGSLILSAALVEMVDLKTGDKISVVYKGSHQAHRGSQLTIAFMPY